MKILVLINAMFLSTLDCLPYIDYIEESLYSCHSDNNIEKSLELQEVAEKRINNVLWRKRAAEEDEETDEILSIRSSYTITKIMHVKQKHGNDSGSFAEVNYCKSKDRFLSKVESMKVGCAYKISGSFLNIVCVYGDNL